MADIKYRVFLENEPATREQLDQIEDITVEQAIDAIWEARLLVYMATDDKGVWKGPDPAFAPRKRLRVEIDAGSGKFTPLIDGPIVGSDQKMSSEPGQSTDTIVVMDDSVFLNREEKHFKFENKLDHEIASQVFKDAEQIDSTDISTETPPPAGGLPPVEFQKGTAMQVLRRIASRQGMNAYVLPGEEPGASIGVFKRLATEPDGLEPLILLGPDRNVATFTSKRDDQSPASVEAFSLSITDKAVSHSTVTFRDIELLGETPAAESIGAASKRLLPPGKDGSVDVKTAAEAAARKLSFAFQASGSLMTDCYKAALSPYRVVTVKGVEAKQAGNYVIKSVTHTLTRSVYEQSFSLMRNASSDDKSALNDLLGAIF